MSAESLTFGLREVQKARSELESRLNEKRQKRRRLESILEKVNSKLVQAKDLHTKMTETMKIAQHKVAQSQAQSSSMEANNKEKRDTLESINQKMKDIQCQRTNHMHQFEEDLSKTAKQMVEAKNFYSERSMSEKITEAKEKYNQHLLKDKELEEEVAVVKKHLAQLEGQVPTNTDDQIDRQAVMGVFTEEKNKVLKSLEILNLDIEATKQSLEKQAQLQ